MRACGSRFPVASICFTISLGSFPSPFFCSSNSYILPTFDYCDVVCLGVTNRMPIVWTLYGTLLAAQFYVDIETIQPLLARMNLAYLPLMQEESTTQLKWF
jgi:hypothetical protein